MLGEFKNRKGQKIQIMEKTSASLHNYILLYNFTKFQIRFMPYTWTTVYDVKIIEVIE